MKDLNQMLKKYYKLILFAIFIVAIIARWFYLPQRSLTFGYDQARDAFSSEQIINGHLKIQGPSASTPGLYHGVFYYYLLAPAYFLGHDNPVVAAYWMSFLNSLTVFLIFYLTYQLTRKTGISLLASFIFAISFESTQYASWLSNPTIGIWTVPLIYIGLWAWIKEKKAWGPVVTALGLGASIQGEIFLAYHLVPVILWLSIARKNIDRKSLTIFGGIFLLSIFSMILASVRFGILRSISGITSLFLSKDAIVSVKGLGDFLILYLNQFGRIFTNSVMPFNEGYAGAFGLFGVFWIARDWFSKQKETISWQLFLLTFLFAHLSVVSLGGVSTPFLTVGLGEAAIIVTSVVLSKLWEKYKFIAILAFSVIIISNFIAINSQNRMGQTLFAIQKDMTLKNEEEAIDYIYQKSSGKPFSISTLTSPLYINVTWSYLFNWYGNTKYGYLPYWVGHDQIGQLGNNLQFAPNSIKEHFFIMEPTYSIPELYIGYAKGDQESMSNLVEQKSFGEIVVQERMMKNAEQ